MRKTRKGLARELEASNFLRLAGLSMMDRPTAEVLQLGPLWRIDGFDLVRVGDELHEKHRFVRAVPAFPFRIV